MTFLSVIASIISVCLGIYTISIAYKYFNWRINND